jgi:hypothetical protein
VTVNPSTKDLAREQAAEVGGTTREAGQRVAGTAVEQAGQVGQEARRQARDLLEQAKGQVGDQARNGQQQASSGLRSLAQELHQMADGGDRQGPASDLAKQAADKLEEFAEWLSRREPGDLIEEVRSLARRRPGAFLLGAAAAGAVAGRLTRGAVDANRDTGDRGLPQPGIQFGASPPAGTMPLAPGGAAPGYPAGPSPEPRTAAPGSLPPDPGSERSAAPPVGSGGYPAPSPGGVALFDDPGVSPRSYPAGAADVPVVEPGAPTPPSGTQGAGEYVEDLEARGEARHEAGGPR